MCKFELCVCRATKGKSKHVNEAAQACLGHILTINGVPHPERDADHSAIAPTWYRS